VVSDGSGPVAEAPGEAELPRRADAVRNREKVIAAAAAGYLIQTVVS